MEEIISIIGHLLTWITVLLVFLTLREMEKQRKASQKPELVIPNVSIFGFGHIEGEVYIATYWCNEKIIQKHVIGELPKFVIYNIGLGAAKSITIKWDFDLQSTVKYIQEYCYKYSLPITVNIEKGEYLSIEVNGNSLLVSEEAYSIIEKPYLMPASITSSSLEIELPLTHLSLSSIIAYLSSYNPEQRYNKVFPPGLSEHNILKFEIPKSTLEIEYYDIGDLKYKKKYDIQLSTQTMLFYQENPDPSVIEPIFYGYYAFKERK